MSFASEVTVVMYARLVTDLSPVIIVQSLDQGRGSRWNMPYLFGSSRLHLWHRKVGLLVMQLTVKDRLA
ncbi:hypothetical protein [Paenibacillus sp. JSM ZJ436]|uniref:hypothetical protein n=1 Tax=Paenibacillus sp. JSM ZJ436 TaxID=3376190 RepID=UPI0037C7EB3B